jgi:hypothetical protein
LALTDFQSFQLRFLPGDLRDPKQVLPSLKTASIDSYRLDSLDPDADFQRGLDFLLKVNSLADLEVSAGDVSVVPQFTNNNGLKRLSLRFGFWDVQKAIDLSSLLGLEELVLEDTTNPDAIASHPIVVWPPKLRTLIAHVSSTRMARVVESLPDGVECIISEHSRSGYAPAFGIGPGLAKDYELARTRYVDD